MISEDHQRTILQFLLLERMMTYADFSDMICRVVGTETDIDAVIDSLNEKIRRFSQKILMPNSEITGEKIVILASTADKAEIKGTLNKDEMDYFYNLMDSIISNQGSVTFINALNSAPLQTSGRITISAGEKLLDLFIRKKMLITEKGLLFLSPLAIAELTPYIMENYSLESCMLCKKTVVLGGPCPSCQGMVHSPCATAYVIGNKRQARCPSCKGDWSKNLG